MPLFQRFENGTLVEEVRTAPNSPEDKRLRVSPAWKRVDESAPAPASAAALAPAKVPAVPPLPPAPTSEA